MSLPVGGSAKGAEDELVAVRVGAVEGRVIVKEPVGASRALAEALLRVGREALQCTASFGVVDSGRVVEGAADGDAAGWSWLRAGDGGDVASDSVSHSEPGAPPPRRACTTASTEHDGAFGIEIA